MLTYLGENTFLVIGAVGLTVAAKINNVVHLKLDEKYKIVELISQMYDQSKKKLDFCTII